MVVARFLRRSWRFCPLVPSQIKTYAHRARMPSGLKDSFQSHFRSRARANEDRVSSSIARLAFRQCGLSQHASSSRYSEETVPRRAEKIDDMSGSKFRSDRPSAAAPAGAYPTRSPLNLASVARTLGRRLAAKDSSSSRLLDGFRFDLAKRSVREGRFADHRSRGFFGCCQTTRSIIRSNAGTGARPSDTPMAILK